MLAKQRFNEIIGANLKKLRLAKGLTQDQLATECGFYRTYINLLETARRTPSSYNLHRIARQLGVGIEQIYPKSE